MIVTIINICILIIVVCGLGWYMWHLIIERIYINISNYFYRRKVKLWKESIIEKHKGYIVHFNMGKIFTHILEANQSDIKVKMGKGCEGELMKLDLWSDTLKYKLLEDDTFLLIGFNVYRFMGEYWIEKP